MEDLMEQLPTGTFDIASSYHFSQENCKNLWVTMIRNDQLGAFTASDLLQNRSKYKAICQPFEHLRKISGMFSCFKSSKFIISFLN